MSRLPSSNTKNLSRPHVSSSSQNDAPKTMPPVRPLQINRDRASSTGARPSTPGTTSTVSSSPTGAKGPTRPVRSGLRERRVSGHSASDHASIDSRITRDSRASGEGTDTARPDVSAPLRLRNNASTLSVMSNDRSRPAPSPISPLSPGSDLSPTSLAAVAAFQSFGRKRGFANDSPIDAEYERERERELEVQKARQQRLRDRVPGRRATGKAKAGDIDAVLDEIKGEWEIVTEDDVSLYFNKLRTESVIPTTFQFNPVELALQLLDDSSLGKDMDSFRRTKDMLSKALKGSVDKYYQAFAGALPHHGSLLNHVGVTQDQVREARTSLQEAKDTLGSKRADLVQLWSRSQTVDEMMRILDQIERLRTVPDVLESLISEKRLLQAAVLLVRSLKLINKQDMLDIGAVSDLRSYLVTQEVSLREILVDELQSHLYLRSFWCESRWAVYTPGQQAFPVLEEEELLSPRLKPSFPLISSPNGPGSKPTRLARFLDELALRPNDPPFDITEQHGPDSSSVGLAASGSTPAIGLSTGQSSNSLNGALPGITTSFFPNTLQPPARNPEADSFSYIETVLESLAVLGKLGTALDVVSQKLPGEISTLVEATLDEVEERAEFGRRGSALASMSGTGSGRLEDVMLTTSAMPSGGMGFGTGIPGVTIVPGAPRSAIGITGRVPSLKAASIRLTALESSTKQGDQETLRDFFWTLYSKLDAVTQALRVVYEVSNRIGSVSYTSPISIEDFHLKAGTWFIQRRDFRDSSGAKPGSLFPLAEVWMPVQAEVRTLISDYVTDEEQGTVSGRNPISSINEVLREGKFNRDKTKSVFRFADTDIKSTMKVLKQHEDDLTRVLKDSVPGLVQGSADSAVQATLSAVGTDDRLAGTGQHHRVLVHPDAFHVSILFQPTLAWLDRISGVLPSGLEAARASSVVLDEFVLNVYLPQLEDKVSLLFHQTVTGPDAFEPDLASLALSHEPLVKASVQVMALINSLCAMLRTTPFHRENYSRLILTVIGQFYQRCSDRFYDLVSIKDGTSQAGSRVALAAQWAQKSELATCLSGLFGVVNDSNTVSKRIQLCQQEAHLEQNFLAERSIDKQDLILSIRNLSALAGLYTSITWFARELDVLKSAPDVALSPTTPMSSSKRTIESPSFCRDGDALHMTFVQLAELIIYTLRIDVRCRAIHHLDLALKHGVYKTEREVSEPDPNIIDLNIELGRCDEWASSALPGKERRYMFEGLGLLLERLLISNARHIRTMNAFGIKKMTRNMLALQQNIKTITQDNQDADFERAKRYYSLFAISPQQMLDDIRQKQEFSFDEYKTMLDLQCGVDPGHSEGGAAQATDRNYSMYVIDLHGLEMENSTEEVT
ncbi:uncharacterized protein FIBRA_00506 [Fibroporia radiculosa]|uniref:Exocyst complex component Sec8 n=1 Tax=Fibroporia radiculosa TaxID=599839 RepID=J4HRQ5_9APHY|nr:uncharacterized protein FIBRA_00506 [Fibroporia radiculosa]CCL98507.1 predicted protein [Fibroporia radiculosa]